MANIDTWAEFYFHQGLTYKYILGLLAEEHDIVISLRTLKRILRRHGLFRRKFHSPILDVASFIEDTIASVGKEYGYRWMHLHCIHNGLTVVRDEVSVLMKILDPIGVERRLRHRLTRRQYYAKGPDFIWHVDSYDKLKRYGLCINGCIDGFSRKIIWLNAYITSSDPKVIAGYYMEVVSKKMGCPILMRGDMGTENTYVAQMQEFLTERDSFLYGRSTTNQRTEMFWNFLLRHCFQFWINTLGELADDGFFTGDVLDKNLVQFCFLQSLQNDLDQMALLWNSHHIRSTKNSNCPHGRPLVMYSLPHMYGTTGYLEDVDDERVNACIAECVFRHQMCDEDLEELCKIYIEENSWLYPQSLSDASVFYKNIRRKCRIDLSM